MYMLLYRYISELIGKGGSVRKALQDHTGVKIVSILFIYVCAHVCMCMPIYVYICIPKRLLVYSDLWPYMYMYFMSLLFIYMHTCLTSYLSLHTSAIHTRLYLHTHQYTYTYMTIATGYPAQRVSRGQHAAGAHHPSRPPH